MNHDIDLFLPYIMDKIDMADEIFMYGVAAAAFAVLTGILFGSRGKRKGEERKLAAGTGESSESGRSGAI